MPHTGVTQQNAACVCLPPNGGGTDGTSVRHSGQYKAVFVGKVHYTHGYIHAGGRVAPPYWFITHIVHNAIVLKVINLVMGAIHMCCMSQYFFFFLIRDPKDTGHSKISLIKWIIIVIIIIIIIIYLLISSFSFGIWHTIHNAVTISLFSVDQIFNFFFQFESNLFWMIYHHIKILQHTEVKIPDNVEWHKP